MYPDDLLFHSCNSIKEPYWEGRLDLSRKLLTNRNTYR